MSSNIIRRPFIWIHEIKYIFSMLFNEQKTDFIKNCENKICFLNVSEVYSWKENIKI